MTGLLALLAIILIAGIVTFPWNSRRWGGDQVPASARPPDPVWEPWAFMERPEPVVLPERAHPPAIYRVGEPLSWNPETGELIEPSAPRQIGGGS